MQRLCSQLLFGLIAIIFVSETAVSLEIEERDKAIALFSASEITAKRDKQAVSPDSSRGLFQQLNLTPQQKNQIKQIRRQYQGQIIRLKQNLQLAQQQLAVMMAGTDSVAVIRAKHQEIAQFRQQLGQLHFESMLATREVLTPDQRQTFAEIIRNK